MTTNEEINEAHRQKMIRQNAVYERQMERAQEEKDS